MFTLRCSHSATTLPHLTDKFLDIHLVNIEIIGGFQDMVLLAYNFLHIPLQMFPEQADAETPDLDKDDVLRLNRIQVRLRDS